MRLIVTSHGFEFIEQSMRASAGRAGFAKPALEAVAEDMMRIEGEVFESQGRRGGGSWTFLKPDTVRRKLRAGRDPRILFGDHRLVDSLTKRGDPDMTLFVTNRGIRFGSNLPYADTHQFGDEGRGIPARPFIKFTNLDQQRWAEIIASYIIDPMRARLHA